MGGLLHHDPGGGGGGGDGVSGGIGVSDGGTTQHTSRDPSAPVPSDVVTGILGYLMYSSSASTATATRGSLTSKPPAAADSHHRKRVLSGGDSMDMEVYVDNGAPMGSGAMATPPPRRNLSVLQMLLLNSIVCGLEFCASAAFCYIPPLLLKSGISEENMSFFLGIGPMLGFLFVPIIGRSSDRCRSRYGRRRPFIFGLSLLLIFSLVMIPYGEVLAAYMMGTALVSKPLGTVLLVMGAVLLDFSSQACLTPCEALLSDASRNTAQHARCFTIYSFMVSLGGCIGYLITALDWSGSSLGAYLGNQERSVFSVLIVLFIFSMLATLGVAQETPNGGDGVGGDAAARPCDPPPIDATQINRKLDQIHQALVRQKSALEGSADHDLDRDLDLDLGLLPNSAPGLAGGGGGAGMGGGVGVGGAHVEALGPAAGGGMGVLGLPPNDPGYESGSNQSASEEVPMLDNTSDPRAAAKDGDGGGPPTTQTPTSSSPSTQWPWAPLLPTLRLGERTCNIPLTRWSFTTLDSLLRLLLLRLYHLLPNMIRSLLSVPYCLHRLALANFFSWTAIMGFNLYYTDFVGQAVYGGDPNAEEGSVLRQLYDKGVRMGSWGLLLHCIVSAIYAAFIERLVARYGTRLTYLVGMATFTVAMMLMVFVRNIYMVTMLAACTGFGYATVTTVPFMLITLYHEHKEIFFYDTRVGGSCRVPLRGMGTDMATLDSAYFLSQVVLSAIMGYVVHLTGTVLAYVVCMGAMGALSCTCVSRIIYNKMQMQQLIKNEFGRPSYADS